LVGQEVPDKTWDLVMRLKGKPKAIRRQILAMGMYKSNPPAGQKITGGLWG